jgi:cellulose biosynthesis protein BcsQ
MVEATPAVRDGLIYTFYSFKGGVGRSMALANVAVLLAQWGKQVLVVDWDLEAPGLERFFDPWIGTSRRETPGLLEWISAGAPSSNVDWRDCVVPVSVPQAGLLHFISAGRDDGRYTERLQVLDWEELFEVHELGSRLEKLRQEWIREYDFVLIDSRTGITDIGGICTIHLPDVLVCFFTTTEQSLTGVKEVIERARERHSKLPVDRQRLLIVPVPSRDESRTEYELAQTWRARFASELESYYSDWIPKTETAVEILDLIKIPYIAYWSFGERLPVIQEDVDNPDKLASFYKLLARLLVTRLDVAEVKHSNRPLEAGVKALREEERVAQRRLDDFVAKRWRPAIEEMRRANVYRLGMCVGLAASSVAFYVTSLPNRAWVATLGLPVSVQHILFPAALFGGLLVSLILALVARRSQRFQHQLVQERSLLEGRAGRYRGPTTMVVPLFIERVEETLGIARDPDALMGVLRRLLQRGGRPAKVGRKEWLDQEARFRALQGRTGGIWMRSTSGGQVTWNVTPMAGSSMEDVRALLAEARLARDLLFVAGIVAAESGVDPEDEWLETVRELTPSEAGMFLESRVEGAHSTGRSIDDLERRSADTCVLLAGGVRPERTGRLLKRALL